MNEVMDRQRKTCLDGADVLRAYVHGNSIPELKLPALDKARELYGQAARLRIEHTGPVSTSPTSRRGKFTAEVTLRCLSLPEEDRRHSSGR